MTEDKVQWLVNELSDYLDTSPVGLYEFLWILRGGKFGMSDAELHSTARDALIILLHDKTCRLVWLKWASDYFEEASGDFFPGPEDWQDPQEAPYLAVDRL